MFADLIDGFSGDAAVQGDEIDTVLGMEADDVNKIFGGQRIQVSLVMDTLSYTGTVPIMAGHSEVSFRRNGCVLPWLDRSMMASAPILTAESTFCISTS